MNSSDQELIQKVRDELEKLVGNQDIVADLALEHGISIDEAKMNLRLEFIRQLADGAIISVPQANVLLTEVGYRVVVKSPSEIQS